MLRGKVVTVFALCLAALASGMPQNQAVDGQQSPTSPPLIQFTDGGIRVNFAGFHAQAGLGGLLTGSQAGGGLHVSAGTPWGANAAAGLGGALDGNNPNARGGLYARARFSEGGPAAGAGLGGGLGGYGPEPLTGGIYASASTGASQSASTEPSTNAGTPDPAKSNPPRGRSNIQIISRKKVTSQQQSRQLNGKADSSTEKDPTAVKTVQNTKTPDAVPASATGKTSVSGSSTAQANAAPLDPQAAVSEVEEKVKTISKSVSIEPAPIVPALPDQVKDVPAVFTKEVTVLHPKRMFRKRLWGPRKQIIYTVPAEAQEPEAAHSQSIARRQVQGSVSGTYVPGTRQQDQKPDQNNGFYDDIFNIPVSTLNAVNRLLNNNAG